MSELARAVADVFRAGGALQSATEEFRHRSQQDDMAQAVASAIEGGGTLVVEAGTGVGKTFAYLVPALLSGERVLLSTATKTLQDQLFGRDLPRLAQALGLPLRTALLKGRSSYLCLHRLEASRGQAALPDRAAVRDFARIERWAPATRSGDLAELPELDERASVIPLVTSTRENCLGSDCPKLRSCHVALARREALAADVVVINHHLFFADLAVRESGMAELLPTAKVVVFDEAHQLNETGIQFLGAQVGTAQLIDLARDILATGLQLARGLADWHTIAAALERAARDLRLVAGAVTGNARLRWQGEVPERLDAQAWQGALAAVLAAARDAAAALDTVSEIAPDFVRLHERVAAITARVERFAGEREPGTVRWVEAGQQLRLVESPLDIADTVRTRLLRLQAEASVPEEQEPRSRSWVFTSATLGDDASLSWFTGPCGLETAQVLRVGSPFDYARQAALYLPPGMPQPQDPAHSLAVARLAGDGAALLGGRTLVLTTTLRALHAIGAALSERFLGDPRVEVLVQGQQARRRLMERFRQGGAEGLRGCVLVASASFWEGVDVPGEALQLLVIDKLPFPPPSDPLVEARSQRLEREGRSAFNDYFLPEAAVSLKQGAGRLIRRETDRGILALCDPRVAGKGYGRRLLAALPAMRMLRTAQEFEEMLRELAATRSSTTATGS